MREDEEVEDDEDEGGEGGRFGPPFRSIRLRLSRRSWPHLFRRESFAALAFVTAKHGQTVLPRERRWLERNPFGRLHLEAGGHLSVQVPTGARKAPGIDRHRCCLLATALSRNEDRTIGSHVPFGRPSAAGVRPPM